MSLLYLLPSDVTPGALADEFTSPIGVSLSPSRVTPGALADEFTSSSGVSLSLSNVISDHSASCGFRVPAACLVVSETLYARARLAFSYEKTKSSGVLLSDFACGGKKKIFLIPERKKKLSVNTNNHILYFTLYVICVLFIMIFSLCFLFLY